MSAFALAAEQPRLPSPYRNEADVVGELVSSLAGHLPDWAKVVSMASPWVEQVRAHPAPFWALETLLREFPISSNEGLALMRLAEALLRVPDVPTAIALTADQLGRGEFGGSLSATAIALSKKFLPDADGAGGLLHRLGAEAVVAATVRSIQLLGKQFVLGRTIQEAMGEADRARRSLRSLRFSYDMLGEGARTDADARRYQAAYLAAINAVASSSTSSDGISIKLSALCPRYEVLQRTRVSDELLPRLWQLIEKAAAANINLTIDAEEVERLELSLDLLDALARRIALQFPLWRGFGLAIQAYQTRALPVIEAVAAIARQYRLYFMVRLVKGAYWDAEIKRAQELGLTDYPVFTQKQHTDVSYLACANALLKQSDVIYPQFASHNAGTIAAILNMANAAGVSFELQRLHGMGEGIYREVLKVPRIVCRVYAPVGEHKDLLAYLVRRLLENGANSSFVHQLADPSLAPEDLLISPMTQLHVTATMPLPSDLFCDAMGGGRTNSVGLDLTDFYQRTLIRAAMENTHLTTCPESPDAQVDQAMVQLSEAFSVWRTVPVFERASILRRAADLLQAKLPVFCALLVKEAFKTLGDTVAEVREAVDFLRYYADQAEQLPLQGYEQQGRGVFVCISPWNFPLAIFTGQIAAALVTGNTVAAKPAEQTPYIACRMVALLHEAGIPQQVLIMLHGAGERIGAALVAHPLCAGVCFTGSTAVAQHINRVLAAKPGPVLPLIAETGGINAMLVDSTALPEQVVDAVIQSAFRSAGQRCSALRLLCVQDSIADQVLEMLSGAMQLLCVGDPADLATDVGPLIDDHAYNTVLSHVERLKRDARLICEVPLGSSLLNTTGHRFIAPVAFQIEHISQLGAEIFGPVLQVVRWTGEPEEVITQINALGYGLTMGIQSRIDSRAQRLAAAAHIGNVYVNRNMIGAVVGVQPFGGEGLSGTGPKAGGPWYLRRFVSSAAEDPCAHCVTVIQQRVQQAQTEFAAVKLPGPTGESNELRRRGRGLILLVDAEASAVTETESDKESGRESGRGARTNDETLRMTVAVAAALLAGNTVALQVASHQQDAARQMVDILIKAGVPRVAVQQRRLVDAAFVSHAITADNMPLAGVVLLSGETDAIRSMRQQLAQRGGAIVPVMTAQEACDPLQFYRFASEQTLTINTAAAGGNAALLAGGY
ncbi:bifunctional proline dehydrogenase/L-glutamate gamma-semialdehyde dehydrogenase PutA [Gammaproteobacteria bacterium LSUCC0112]|nr:bifunctional proline dehydrogenase/L-glutamate gamma-semialdehyde dehydrogenase PutA [Gammaproteobacteria bacterium LSUCC0112]